VEDFAQKVTNRLTSQNQNRERFYERAVKKKYHPEPPRVLGS
jgi:hypothetical protein